MLTRTMLTAGILLCAAGLAAACAAPGTKDGKNAGTTSPKEYKRAATKISNTAELELQEIIEAGNPSGKDMARAADVLQQASESLARLDPPKKVEQAHDKMVSGLSGLAHVYKQIADALTVPDADPKKARELMRSVPTDPAIAELREAQNLYKKAGYTLDGEDGESK